MRFNWNENIKGDTWETQVLPNGVVYLIEKNSGKYCLYQNVQREVGRFRNLDAAKDQSAKDFGRIRLRSSPEKQP